MLGYVLVHNEAFLVNMQHPAWLRYQPFKWYLLPHGLAGAFALLLGPLQFSDRLRRKYAKFHRVAGRLYVFGALVASPFGFMIQYTNQRLGAPPSLTMISVTHGGLWFLTTAIALTFILKGKVQQHRQWMTRSFLIGPGVFLGARVALGLGGLEQRGPMVFAATVWMCIALAIPLADLMISWQDLLAKKPAMNKAHAAAD